MGVMPASRMKAYMPEGLGMMLAFVMVTDCHSSNWKPE